MKRRRKYPYRAKHHPRKKSKILKIKPGADARLKKVFAAIGVPEKSPFKPDPFQLEALAAIKQADCLVTAPTGAGKTWIAQQAIDRIYSKGGKSWYASPLKALSNSKYAEFSELFGAANVGILTGDRKENPDAPVIVGTTEILRNQLYDAMHHGVTLPTDFVILDEAHFLGDADRGVVWEETIIYLPSRIPLLLLSATIGNANHIAQWLASVRKKKCLVIEETQRPVPLHPLFLHPSGTLLPLTSHGSPKKNRLYKKVASCVSSDRPPLLAPPRKLPPFGDILRVLKKYRLLPAIFFLKSRADCDHALDRCVDNLIMDQDRKEKLSQRITALVSHSPYIARHRQLWHLEHLGVGAHHSGQLPAWKLTLETLMTEGLLDAIFATSTVAAGVNFPARTIVFFNSDRFNGKEFVPLNPTEFHQMTGRAGRRGMDHIGFAVVVPGKFMDVRLISKILVSPPSEIVSQIKINFSMVLNLLLSHNPDQIEALLSKSLATYTMMKAKKHPRRRPYFSFDHKYLWQSFVKHLDFLQATGYVAANGTLMADGTWASQLRVDQPLMIAEGFRMGIFPQSDPALLAAIIATFVYEREVNNRIEKTTVPQKLVTAFQAAQKHLTPFAKQMAKRGFDVRPLFLRPAATIFAWAIGQPWEKVVATAEIEEGDLAMLILRTADNLSHVRSLGRVFPQAAQTAATAIELIMREPVTMDYDT